VTTSPLAKKLLIKPWHRVVVLNPPAGHAEMLHPLPDGAQVLDVSDPVGEADAVLAFARDRAELERVLAQVRSAVQRAGLVWVAYPKGGKKAGTDLNRDILHALMSEEGLTGVTLVAVDETWSAMRFRT
jgi:hypothetical protein